MLAKKCAVDEYMQPPIKPQSQDLLPLVDQRALKDWSGDLDRDDVLAILAQVPDEFRRNVAAMESAVAEGCLPAAKRIAHRLKGMAGNLGAARLAQLARDIELGSESIEDVSGHLGKLNETLTQTIAALTGC
jgi:histidine phosphotransfer protein HptB